MEAAWSCMTPQGRDTSEHSRKERCGHLKHSQLHLAFSTLSRAFLCTCPSPSYIPPALLPAHSWELCVGLVLLPTPNQAPPGLSFSCCGHTLYLSGIVHTVLGYSYVGKSSRPFSQSCGTKDPDKEIPFQGSGDLIK